MDRNITSILHSDDYQMIFNSVDEGINILGKVDTRQNERIDFRYILTNPAFEKITGLTGITGKTVIEVLPGVNDTTMQLYDTILKTGQPVRFETYEKSLDKWFSVFAFPIDAPELKWVAVIFNDISAIKKSEITLHENAACKDYLLNLSNEDEIAEKSSKYFNFPNEQQYVRNIRGTLNKDDAMCLLFNTTSVEQLKAVFDAVPSSVVIVNVEGQFLYVNQRGLELYGFNYSGFDMTAHISKVRAMKRNGDTFPLEDMPVSHSLKSGKVVRNVEMIIENVNGIRYPVNVSSAPLQDNHGEVNGAVVIFEEFIERKQAEEALIEINDQLAQSAEEKYRLLFNLIDQGFFIIDIILDENDRPVDMYYVEANNAATKMLGIDYTGKRLRDIDPNYEEYWFEIFGNVALTGQSVRMEQYAEPDKKWYSFYIFKIGGEMSRRIGNIFFDITESKRAEDAIKESEWLFRTLFENTEDGFTLVQPIFDESGHSDNYLTMNVNQAWAKQTGLKADDFVGKTIKESMPGIESILPEAFANVAKSGESKRFEIFNHNTNRWYDLYAFNYQGGLVGVLFRDISERKKIEEALRESEGRLRALTVASTNVVYRMSPDWSTMTELYGNGFLADTEKPNVNWIDMYIHPEDREYVTGVINECIREKKTFELEHRVLQADGSIGWTYSKAVPLPDGHGGIQEWFGTASDITVRKKMEEALQKSEERQVFLLKLSDILRPLSDPVEIQSTAVRLLGEHLAVNQVHYGETVGDDVIIHQGYDNGLPPMVGRFRYMDFGERLVAIYRTGHTAVCYNVATDPTITEAEAAVITGSGFRAYIAVPLVKDGQWVATLAAHSIEPRAWTPENVAIVEEVAERTWAAVERARAEEALRKNRLLLEAELVDVKRLQSISMELLSEDNTQVFYERLIDTAMHIMRSEYGSMQLLHTEYGKSDKLQLIVFRGFNPIAAKFWEWVDADDASTCGYALRTGQRVIVPDVEKCDSLQGTEDQIIQLQTGIHAVQSTPLYSRSGKMVGVISTHWREPHEPSERELSLLDILARQAADIIERKRLEEELRFQKELFESVIENMNDALAIYNKEGRIEFMNAEARKMYPHINNHTIVNDYQYGSEYSDLENNIIPVENLPTQRVLRGEKIKNEKILIKRPDKDQFTEINATPIFNNEGNLVSAVVAQRDITELVNHQRALREHQEQLLKVEQEKSETLEEAIKLKDEFLYLITHEFKTPITVISSVIQSIDSFMKADVSERLGRYLNMIKMNTNRQLRLVNNLLEITRMSSGNIKLNMSNFDIVYVTKAIISSVELYAMQKSVTLSFTTEIAKKEVYLDEEKYERIMLNLLSNALKFTPKGKSINVVLSTKKLRNQNVIRISVKDEGIGIPADKQKIVFERFGQADTSMSRQAEGTGLGLHLVKILVDSLGGEISLNSEVGCGSAFTVLLPVIKTPDLGEAAASSEHSGQMINKDSRIIQAVSIEFSDIYFD